jgi:hypothetical protein
MARIRFGRAPRANASDTGADDPLDAPAWCDELARNARAHGASPYVVEGFADITDAVKRGHAVLVRRECVEVADGVTVFDSEATPITGPFAAQPRKSAAEPIVAILRFDVGTARFVLQDAHSPAGGVQLTPRRLATYLDDPDRSIGIALGA